MRRGVFEAVRWTAVLLTFAVILFPLEIVDWLAALQGGLSGLVVRAEIWMRGDMLSLSKLLSSALGMDVSYIVVPVQVVLAALASLRVHRNIGRLAALWQRRRPRVAA